MWLSWNAFTISNVQLFNFQPEIQKKENLKEIKENLKEVINEMPRRVLQSCGRVHRSSSSVSDAHFC